jgi:cytochrome c peroxidase
VLLRPLPPSRCICVRGNRLPQTPEDTSLLAQAKAQLGVLEPVSPSAIGPVAELGRALFWDTRLSADGQTACASCHRVADWGADRRPLSPDARGKLTARNSQTVFNAMLRRHGYEPLFRQACPNDPAPLTVTNYAKALETYQSTLVTPARFDGFLVDDRTGLNGSQKAGLRLFLNLGCAECHSGTLLGGAGLQRFGVKKPCWEATKFSQRDTGLHETTKLDGDRDQFRVSTLWNIARSAPSFHDVSVADLKDAVQVMAEVQLGQRLGENDLEDRAGIP